MAVDQFAPLVLMMFNYQFIPTMVFQTGKISEYQLKTDRHLSNMNRYFFFFIFNTIFIPLTGVTTIP